jgi:hypothetical protein
MAVEFIDSAEAVYAHTILADTGTIGESGGAFVTGAGNDFAESVCHVVFLCKFDDDVGAQISARFF